MCWNPRFGHIHVAKMPPGPSFLVDELSFMVLSYLQEVACDSCYARVIEMLLEQQYFAQQNKRKQIFPTNVGNTGNKCFIGNQDI